MTQSHKVQVKNFYSSLRLVLGLATAFRSIQRNACLLRLRQYELGVKLAQELETGLSRV